MQGFQYKAIQTGWWGLMYEHVVEQVDILVAGRFLSSARFSITRIFNW